MMLWRWQYVHSLYLNAMRLKGLEVLGQIGKGEIAVERR